MDFAYSDKVKGLQQKLQRFMDAHVYPNERRFHEEVEANRAQGDPWVPTKLIEELKPKARAEGLWNLFLPRSPRVPEGLSNLEYAPLCEIMGRVHWAPEAFNCSAPDTGNMETLERYGTEEQKKRWLDPLLAGEIRSAFLMTEPEVASSDAANIQCRIEHIDGKAGGDYVVNGRKWWSSGAGDPRCKLFILMGKTDPGAAKYARQSMILVPRCMRLVGVAERALELMCRRSLERVTFGKPVAERTVTQERIAESRIMIDSARLLVLKAAHTMDSVGNKAARAEIAMIKVLAPNVACQVLDWAIQAHGGGGMSEDFPLAYMYAHSRTLRFADGPDEVHRNAIAKLELAKHAPAPKR